MPKAFKIFLLLLVSLTLTIFASAHAVPRNDGSSSQNNNNRYGSRDPLPNVKHPRNPERGTGNSSPKYLNGNPFAQFLWLKLRLHALAETQCVNLHIVGPCFRKGKPGIKLGYRQPVQLMEGAANMGETMWNEWSYPFGGNFIDLMQTTAYYPTVTGLMALDPASLGAGANPGINFKKGQRRRSNQVHAINNGSSFSEGHLYPIDSSYVPAIIAWMPKRCKSYSNSDPFVTDVPPITQNWRFSYLTANALPGSYDVTPADCTNYNVSVGKTSAALFDLNLTPTSFVNPAVIAQTCLASNWGGKIWPLEGHSNGLRPSHRALNSLRTIELSRYATSHGLWNGTPAHAFNYSKDRLEPYYPSDKKCIKAGQPTQTWANNFDQENKEDLTTFIHWKYRTCCITGAFFIPGIPDL